MKTFSRLSLSTKSLYRTSNSLVLSSLKIINKKLNSGLNYRNPLSEIVKHQASEAPSEDQYDKDNVVPSILVVVIVFCLQLQILDMSGNILVDAHPKIFCVVSFWHMTKIGETFNIKWRRTIMSFPDVKFCHFWFLLCSPLLTGILTCYVALKVYLLSTPG